MRLSIIVPVYNTEAYLRETLQSAMAQSVQDMEIICVDDRSTDSSWEILCEAAKQDSRILLLRQPHNQGVAHARKWAASQSTGKYIMFLDGDDSLEENACASLLDEIEEQQVDILHFHTMVRRGGATTQSEVDWFTGFAKPYESALRREDLYNACFVEKCFGFTLWNKIYNGDIVRKAFSLFPDVRMDRAEDLLTSFMIQYFSLSYGVTDIGGYRYSFGTGVTGGKEITLQEIAKYAKQGEVLKALDSFLLSQNAVEKCAKARDTVRDMFVEAAIWNWSREIGQQEAAQAFDMIQPCFSVEDIAACCLKNQEAWSLDDSRLAALLKGSKAFSSQSRKIRTVATFYFRAYNGGIERVMTKQTEIWLRAGYRVVLLTDEEANERDYPYPREVTRVCLKREDEPDPIGGRIRRLAQAIEAYRIDAVVYQAWCSPQLFADLMTLKLCGAAVLIHTHNCFSQGLRSDMLDINILNAQLGMIYQLADAVVTLTDVDTFWWKQWHPYTVKTCNPISIDYASVKPRLTSNHDILWIGRIASEKQPLLALDVFRRVLRHIPDARMHFAGAFENEAMRKAVEEHIDNLEIRESLVFHGFHKDVEPLYAQCSIYLCTSAYEGFLLTLAESKIMGLPCVTFDLRNLDMVREAKGMTVVAQGDVRAAANAIVALMRDESAWHRLSLEARESVLPVCQFHQEQRWNEIFAGIGTKGDRPDCELAESAVYLQAYDLAKGYRLLREELKFYKAQSAGLEEASVFYKAQAEAFEEASAFYKGQAGAFQEASNYYKQINDGLLESVNWFRPRAEAFEKEMLYYQGQLEAAKEELADRALSKAAKAMRKLKEKLRPKAARARGSQENVRSANDME